MASYYAPVSRLEDALLGGAAAGPRRALAEKAAEAEQRQQRLPQQQRPGAPNNSAPDAGNPLAFLARLFFPPAAQ